MWGRGLWAWDLIAVWLRNQSYHGNSSKWYHIIRVEDLGCLGTFSNCTRLQGLGFRALYLRVCGVGVCWTRSLLPDA